MHSTFTQMVCLALSNCSVIKITGYFIYYHFDIKYVYNVINTSVVNEQ